MLNNISSILAKISGVEIIPTPENGQLENSRSFDSEFYDTDHYPRNAAIRHFEFPPYIHPVSIAFTSEAEGAEFESALERAINALRKHLTGPIEDYAPLYLPLGTISQQITVDGYPIRVVMSYDIRNQGFLTSFDTQKLIKWAAP